MTLLLNFDETATATFTIGLNVEHENQSCNAFDDGGIMVESAGAGMEESRPDEACARASDAKLRS